jgi:hypothetical protein
VAKRRDTGVYKPLKRGDVLRHSQSCTARGLGHGLENDPHGLGHTLYQNLGCRNTCVTRREGGRGGDSQEDEVLTGKLEREPHGKGHERVALDLHLNLLLHDGLHCLSLLHLSLSVCVCERECVSVCVSI